MKNLICLAISIVLCGCSPLAVQKFGEGLSNYSQMQQQQRYQLPVGSPAYGTLQAAKQTDNQCMQTCTQAGYQWALCQKNCTY